MKKLYCFYIKMQGLSFVKDCTVSKINETLRNDELISELRDDLSSLL